MIDDIKAMYSAYTNISKNNLLIVESKASINNTTRNTDSYAYSPTEYSQSRQEQEENNSAKTKIANQLQKCTDLSKIGSVESYKKILFDLHTIQKNVQDLLTSK